MSSAKTSGYWYDILMNSELLNKKHPKVQFVTVGPANTGQRIDNFLLSQLKGVPKSKIYRILRKGEVRVNKGRIKPEYKLVEGDQIRIPPVRVSESPVVPKAGQPLLNQLKQAIIFENKELLVVNKPSGVAVHGGSGISLGLIESFRQLYPEGSFLELVHRLDRETSGCIMIAKKRSCLRYIQQQLREGRIQKTYQALVIGKWPKRKTKVSHPLVKNKLQSGERIVRITSPDAEGAKASLTEYKIAQQFSSATLIEAKPITGRTHQIRVHCQSAGHSIIGDDKYGDDEVNKSYRKKGLKRLFLHACKLEFSLIDGTPIVIEAPLDNKLSGVLELLSREVSA